MRRPGIYCYYGGGVFAGVFDGTRYRKFEGDTYPDRNVVSAGISLVLGMELNIYETPYSIAFDLKPRVGIYNPGGSVMEGAVSLKYIWGW